jgi:hypothetical protein
MASNAPLLDKIARTMEKLGSRFGENAMFISQGVDNPKDKATVIIGLLGDKEDDDNNYLQLRRLLYALKYRINKDSRFEFDFNLKRKE